MGRMGARFLVFLCLSTAWVGRARGDTLTIVSSADFDAGTYTGTRTEGSGNAAQLALFATASGAWSVVSGSATNMQLNSLVSDGSGRLYWTKIPSSGSILAEIAWYEIATGTFGSQTMGRPPYGDLAYLSGRLYWKSSSPWGVNWYDPLSALTGMTPLARFFPEYESVGDGLLYMADAPLRSWDPVTGVETDISSVTCAHAWETTKSLAAGPPGWIYLMCVSPQTVNAIELSTGSVSQLPPLPTGWGVGGRIAFDGVDTLYAITGGTAEFYAFSVSQQTWRRLPPLPAAPLSSLSERTGLVATGGVVWANLALASQVLHRFDVVTDYVSSGTYTSQVFDTLGMPDWKRIYWSADVPPGTNLKVQLATSVSAAGPFNFEGPTGPLDYYVDAAGTAISPRHDGDRYARVRVTFDSLDATLSPRLASLTLAYAFNAMAITTSTPLPSGVLGSAYGPLTLQAAGGIAPYTWSVPLGGLPSGLQLEPLSGTLSGTPTNLGNSSFGVTVTDSGASPATDQKLFSIDVQPPPVAPAIDRTANLVGAVGTPYIYNSAGVATASGTTPITWSLSSGPASFNIDPFSGVVRWTPQIAGAVPITITATNTGGTDAYTFTVTIASAPSPPTILPGANTIAAVGLPYRYDTDDRAEAIGTAPITWSVDQAPVGLTLDPVSGYLSWTPQTVGGVSITLRATNPVGSTTYTFTVDVGPASQPPVIDATANLSAVVGQAYLYDVDGAASATGTAPLLWSVASGPAGLAIDAAMGVVTWVPLAPGSVPVALRATNQVGYDEYTFTVEVALSPRPPVIDRTASPSASVAQPYAYDADGAASAGGTPPLTWSLDQAPTGFTLNAGSGVVSWTPQVEGIENIVLRATNQVGTDTYTFTVQVAPTLCVGIGGSPLLLVPEEGAMATPMQATFVWLEVVGASSYRLEVVRVPTGASPVFDDPALQVVDVTTLRPFHQDLLDPATTYAWRVTAMEAVGCPGQTSSVSTFGTGAAPDALVAVAKGRLAAVPGSLDSGPVIGTMPLIVLLSGDDSLARRGHPIVRFGWEFGDGAMPDLDPVTTHTYRLPGGYQAHLSVIDDEGMSSEDQLPIRVQDAQGRTPLLADASADPMRGATSQAFVLRADISEGESRLAGVLWDLGDGTRSDALTLTHTYALPGVYIVHLLAMDEAGFTASDFVAVTVTDASGVEAPKVRLYAEPAVGEPDATRGTLDVDLACEARGNSGEVLSYRWDFGDGNTDESSNVARLRHAYGVGPAGERLYEARCTVSNGQARSSDVVTIELTKNGQRPPRILSLPSTDAVVGQAWAYDADGRPVARGSRPIRWSLGKTVAGQTVGVPEGMTIDPSTGQMRWSPTTASAGQTIGVTLVATNDAGVDAQAWEIKVAPLSPEVKVKRGCCQGGQPGDAGVGLLFLLFGLGLLARTPRASWTRPSR